MNRKKVIYSLLIIFIIITLGIISYSSKIMNPLVGLKGIIQISIGDEKVEKVSDEPLRYISTSYEEFMKYMKLQGYTVEQMGRGFHLEKGDETILLVSEGFMGIYEIFSE